jgi:negative regulator of flagellin synthesis FlgM
MPPINLGPMLPVSQVDPKALRTASCGAKPQPAATPAPEISASDALDPGTPPVDAERVQLIRKAVESGTYPIVPAKVADAIIANGMLLRTSK